MSAIAHLTRRYTFAASHRLHVDALSPEANHRIFGKCNNPFGHGHNYIAQVTFSGHVDPATGMVTNLADLDAFSQRELLDRFDHANLDTLESFRDITPTTENLSVELWRIYSQYPHAKLERIHIEETANNSFDYFGDGASAAHEE